MAELLDDIGFYLDGLGLGDLTGASATLADIQLGLLRDTPDRAIGLIQSPGFPPLETMGENTYPNIERPRMQLFSRWDAQDYQGSMALARATWKALSLICNETVNGTYYQRVVPVDSPVVFDRDDTQRVVFVCNYQVWKAVP